MSRIRFSQALKTTPIDYHKEYDRLYYLFFERKIFDKTNDKVLFPLRDFCAYYFKAIPFRGTCVNLADFNETYGHNYEETPENFDVDYLISFCEYSYNVVCASQYFSDIGTLNCIDNAVKEYIHQIKGVIEKIGYMPLTQDGITDFVPKDQVVITVSEIVDPNLSYKVIEYNHHSVKGNIDRKREILLALANRLEPQKNRLKNINSTFASDLFYLFNAAEIRHNNTEPESDKYSPAIAAMNDEEREKWYDDTYQMCLLAFLELEHIERKKRIEQLKQCNRK